MDINDLIEKKKIEQRDMFTYLLLKNSVELNETEKETIKLIYGLKNIDNEKLEALKKTIKNIKIKIPYEVKIHNPFKIDKCKLCNKKILWGVTTKNKKAVPIDIDLKTSHWGTCEHADRFKGYHRKK